MSVSQAVSQLDAEFQAEIDRISQSVNHNRLELTGSGGEPSIAWKEVLAVFAARETGAEDGAPVPADESGAFALLRLRAGAVLEQLHRSSGTLDSLAHWYLYDLCGYLCGLEFSEKADLEDAYDTSWPLIDAAASKFRGGAMVQVEERLSTDKGREILERMGTPNVTSIMQGGT